MYNLLISAGAALPSFLLLKFAAGLSWWIVPGYRPPPVHGHLSTSFPAIVMKKVMAIMETATKDLQAQRVEKGIRELQSAFKYGKWQIYVTGQINCPDRHGLLHEAGFHRSLSLPGESLLQELGGDGDAGDQLHEAQQEGQDERDLRKGGPGKPQGSRSSGTFMPTACARATSPARRRKSWKRG